MNDGEIAKLKGWKYLDSIGKLTDDQKVTIAKARSLDSLAAQTFATEPGKKLLRWMVQRTVLRPTVTADSTEFQVGIREGQNDLVRQLLAMIERAKKEP